jgi:hypothetical protein
MMDEIFSGMKREGIGGGAGGRAAGGGRGRRRRGSGSEEKLDGNDSDDCSVSSVASNMSNMSNTSNMSNMSNARPTPRGLSSNDVGGGQRKKSPRVRLSNKSGSSSNNKDKSKDDLLTAMTGRLTMLEMTTRRLKDENSKKDATMAKLRKKVSALQEAVESAKANKTAEALTHLAEENDQLRGQIADMEKFLSDYGLVWVGHDENNKKLLEKRKEYEGDDQQHNEPNEGQQEEGKVAWEEEKGLEKEEEPMLAFDRDIFVQRVKELNSMIQADKAKIVTKGKHAKLAYADGVPICLFSDGIVVRREKIRKWDDKLCIKFVADIMDGFFPAEFKAEFPNGVKLDLHDRRESHSGEKNVFKGEGNSLVYGAAGSKIKGLANLGEANFQPMSANEFLERLPEKIVGGGGDVFDIRKGIKERMEGGKKGGEEGKEEEAGEQTGGRRGVSVEDKKKAAAEAAEKRMREAGTSNMGSNKEGDQVVLVETKAVQKLNSSLRRKIGAGGDRLTNDASEGAEEEGKEEEQDHPITTLRVKMDAGGGKNEQKRGGNNCQDDPTLVPTFVYFARRRKN